MSEGWPHEYAIVDTETTGLDPSRDVMLEAAVAIVRGEEIVERWSALADPGRDVPAAIVALTGITNADVRGQPAPAVVAAEARRRIGGRQVLAWNAGFDAGVLGRLWEQKPDFLDGIEIAELLLPLSESFALADLAGALGVVPGAHRALGDCEAVAGVLAAALRRARSRGLAADLQTLTAIYGGVPWAWGPWLAARADGPRDPAPVAAAPVVPTGTRRPATDLVARVFAAEGGLARHLGPGHEPRPPQQDMARRVESALAAGRSLLVEAPTGTGKGVGYLVPLAAWSLSRGQPVLVSTHTLSLQDQLALRDVPLVAAASGLALRAAVLKGRGNYLCPAAVRACVADLDLLATRDDRDALAYLAVHTAHTADGIVERIPDGVRHRRRAMGAWLARATAGEGPCRPGRCEDRRCFLSRALVAAREADVLISNHALTLSWPDTYPAWHAVVFDEGHALEDAATSAFAREISTGGLRDLRRRLGARGGLAAAVGRAYAGAPPAPHIAAALDALTRGRTDLETAARDFGPAVHAYVADRMGRSSGDDLGFGAETALEPASHAGVGLVEACGPLRAALADIEAALQTFVAASADLPPVETADLVARDAERALEQARLAAEALEECLAARESGVCYLAFAQHSAAALRAAPLRVAEQVHARVFARVPAIITSATLVLPSDPEHVARRIGFDRIDPARREPPVVLDSPFEAATASRVFVTADAPDPNDDGDGFRTHTLTTTAALARLLGGRTLLLLASRARVGPLVESLQQRLTGTGVTVLAQGRGSRQQLAARMRADAHTVLVGARSFWEGVDIPGAALSAVVIERIPFPFPEEPLSAARQAAEGADGRDGFRTYTLPRALLLLRQGAGRLLRRRTDRGVVVLLDGRYLRKGYAGDVAAAFPGGPPRAAPTREVLATAEAFLRASGAVPAP